ncbi:CidA/LrgA family protein [Burkholderia sp. WAC0059]|uniref:CidA/LrgA family protein n=1 Tax=Burkholderia sp. WAC0059 TaxID=2066022 RepID=UPI000C7F2684|nr:CidA/LrgA family protein [Burkholderia sp. WAC0059]PLZ01454.1 CidA/LrgA family protein [Burkholderia sp. WAC0059]
MPFAFAVLVVAELVGEVLRRLLHLPLPGPVIGMFLLALLLVTRAGRWIHAAEGAEPPPLAKTSSALISNMGLLFVPAGVGIIAELGVLREEWLPILAGLLVSTVLGLIVTGVIMHRVTRLAERAGKTAGEAAITERLQ